MKESFCTSTGHFFVCYSEPLPPEYRLPAMLRRVSQIFSLALSSARVLPDPAAFALLPRRAAYPSFQHQEPSRRLQPGRTPRHFAVDDRPPRTATEPAATPSRPPQSHSRFQPPPA